MASPHLTLLLVFSACATPIFFDGMDQEQGTPAPNFDNEFDGYLQYLKAWSGEELMAAAVATGQYARAVILEERSRNLSAFEEEVKKVVPDFEKKIELHNVWRRDLQTRYESLPLDAQKLMAKALDLSLKELENAFTRASAVIALDYSALPEESRAAFAKAFPASASTVNAVISKAVKSESRLQAFTNLSKLAKAEKN